MCSEGGWCSDVGVPRLGRPVQIHAHEAVAPTVACAKRSARPGLAAPAVNSAGDGLYNVLNSLERPRIAVGSISQESNHFAGTRTDPALFRNIYVLEGDELFHLAGTDC